MLSLNVNGMTVECVPMPLSHVRAGVAYMRVTDIYTDNFDVVFGIAREKAFDGEGSFWFGDMFVPYPDGPNVSWSRYEPGIFLSVEFDALETVYQILSINGVRM